MVLHYAEPTSDAAVSQHRPATSVDRRTSTVLGGHVELLLLSPLGGVAGELRTSTSLGDCSCRGCSHTSSGHWTSVLSHPFARGASLHREQPLQVLEPPLHRLLRQRSQQGLRGATSLHDFAGAHPTSWKLPAVLRLRMVEDFAWSQPLHAHPDAPLRLRALREHFGGRSLGEPRVGCTTSEGPLLGLRPLSDFKAESLLKVLMKLEPIFSSTSDLLCHFVRFVLELRGLNPLQSEFVCELLAVELLPTSVIGWRISNFTSVCMTLLSSMEPKR